jgi:hypothetical protein
MRPQHFTIHELADPSIIKEVGEEATWGQLDPQLFPALDWLREVFGPISINGMYRGVRFTESGLRRKDTKTGAKFSQHKAGRGYDLKIHNVDEGEVYKFIMANQDEAYRKGIRRVEDIAFTGRVGGGGWLHIDCKNTGAAMVNRIQVVKP